MIRKSGPLNSFDIAHVAGVSQPTVSRALRNSPRVSEKTRRKIHDIAKQLNYRVDKNAANLRSQNTKTIALLIFEDPTLDDSQINPFFLSMLGNITRAASRKNFDLLVSFQQLSDDWYSEYILSHRADGLILLGYGDYISYREKLNNLSKAHAPFVIWGPTDKDHPNHYLSCDNQLGGYLACRHLLELGHRSIGFIGEASEHCPEFLLRYRGYCQAHEEYGLTPNSQLLQFADNLETSGYSACKELLATGCNFTALCAGSDLMAIGAIDALKRSGKLVPDDVAVVGFDDILAASQIDPPLTTIHQNTRLSGELLVEHLVQLINGRSTQSSLIKPSLVIRKSCGTKKIFENVRCD